MKIRYIFLLLIIICSCTEHEKFGRFEVYNHKDLNAYCLIWDDDHLNGDRIWISNEWKLLTIEKYKAGNKNGPTYVFYNDGTLKGICQYYNGIPVGKHIYYSDKKLHYPIQEVYFDSLGKVIHWELTDSNNQRIVLYNPFNKFY